jgi:hypothetical protein
MQRGDPPTMSDLSAQTVSTEANRPFHSKPRFASPGQSTTFEELNSYKAVHIVTLEQVSGEDCLGAA